MLYIGPHVSISGSVAFAADRAHELGTTGFAIFTKNQRQWKSPALKEEDIAAFKAKLEEYGYTQEAILPHAGYLINPASPDPELRAKSIALFQEEASRLEALGLDVINIHPGAFKEGDRIDGIKRCAAALDEVLSAHPTVRIAVENTAGAGTILGSTFEELDMILSEVKAGDRVGFTLDTAHLFGSGYNVRDDVNKVLDEFFSRFSPEKLYGMHLNDSKVPLASNKDRHDSIGAGLIGDGCFKEIVRRKEVQGIPLILETPDETRWPDEVRMLLAASES